MGREVIKEGKGRKVRQDGSREGGQGREVRKGREKKVGKEGRREGGKEGRREGKVRKGILGRKGR